MPDYPISSNQSSSEIAGATLDSFEADWRKRWLVERGVEIISEASRHLTDAVKARHPKIPWRAWDKPSPGMTSQSFRWSVLKW